MTHELVHTAFPDVAEEHHWIEEGIAAYVEPVARTQIGDLTAERIWPEMVRGMPEGEPPLAEIRHSIMSGQGPTRPQKQKRRSELP